ncbi:MAG TPA: 5-oxoprolinase subunit PxpB [Limnochordales bacterium]|nr:5-oxoprolinase subunit PxpB [Limnochordales bacterium]
MKGATHGSISPSYPRVVPAGDEAVLVVFGQEIRRDVNQRVHALARALMEGGPAWVREVVPGYVSLLVYYDPDRASFARVHDTLLAWATGEAGAALPPPRRVEIPVRYGGLDGPDLEWVAAQVGLEPEEVAARHSRPVYVVYMLGFLPGFCYLGDLPPELAVARRATPRLALPAGAVAIGGRQTGIYSLDQSPGGWRWIGRTRLRLWDPRRDPPFLLQAGDEVRFVPE